MVDLLSQRIACAGKKCQWVAKTERGTYDQLSVYRPNLRPQRLILQAQPLFLLRCLRALRLLRRARGLCFSSQLPRVELGDQLAQRPEGVVVVVLRNLGSAAA